jgi:hypothetical protein
MGASPGVGLELLTGQTTAPGTTITALTPSVGNTFTVRSAQIGSPVFLAGFWGYNNAAGLLRVRSPRLHDNQQGIRLQLAAGISDSEYPRWGFKQSLIPQDVLVVENTGSDTDGDIEMGALLLYYGALPGVQARFCTPMQLQNWGLNMMGQYVPITPGDAGGYSGQVAVNSAVDNWKANTDYALMGYTVDADCLAIRIQGVDSGNLGIGGPGLSEVPELTSHWFAWLSAYYSTAMIPIFNAANKNSILVDVATNQGGAAVNITFFFVELPPPSLRT